MASSTHRTPSHLVRDAVMSAALGLLEAGDLDTFTVRSIATKAGVAPMALYNHFDGINGVVAAIWNDGFAQLRQAAEVRTGDAARDMRQSCLNYRTFALGHRGHYTVMFLQRFRHFAMSVENEQMAALAFGALVEQVAAAQSIGFLTSERSTDVAQAIWSALHGHVALEMMGVSFAANSAANYEFMVDGLLRGLGPSSSANTTNS